MKTQSKDLSEENQTKFSHNFASWTTSTNVKTIQIQGKKTKEIEYSCQSNKKNLHAWTLDWTFMMWMHDGRHYGKEMIIYIPSEMHQ